MVTGLFPACIYAVALFCRLVGADGELRIVLHAESVFAPLSDFHGFGSGEVVVGNPDSGRRTDIIAEVRNNEQFALRIGAFDMVDRIIIIQGWSVCDIPAADKPLEFGSAEIAVPWRPRITIVNVLVKPGGN